jgi:Protein of unknown function (DUF1153)
MRRKIALSSPGIRECQINALEPSSPESLPVSDDLPPPDTRRWVARRKAAVVAAVRDGRITLKEALQRYQLTEEDYRSWERAFAAHGLPGLRATRPQQYRTPPSRPRRR